MIYVDRARACVPNPQWRHVESCHLYAPPGDDNAGDLHSFAAGIGLKRRWFQTGGTMPHYDLTRGLRFKAVRQGAIEISDEQLVAHLVLWREAKASLVKYLVVPGDVVSRTDGQTHFIDERQLMNLYRVSPAECRVAKGGVVRLGESFGLTVLRPRFDGDYPCFKK